MKILSVNILKEDAHSVMVTFIENWHSSLGSQPGWGCLHFT